MHSAGTKTGTKRRTLTLVVLSALLLIVGRSAWAQTETVLYTFVGGSDGAHPLSSLTSDGAGNFYGTTPYAGLKGGYDGPGTVFELSPDGKGGWNETTIYSFTGGVDGGNPYAGSMVFNTSGNLYGTATNGGTHGHGVVFKLSRAGSGWTETVLYSFAYGTDGGNPETGLIMDEAGNLYGTTYGCCGREDGTVFQLKQSVDGWMAKGIYSLDTASSYAGITMDAAGNIFGTGNNSVFELLPNRHGGWNPTVIHTFGGPTDGSYAEGTPVFDKAGNLYGTTSYGGEYGYGTVYKLSHRKRKAWKEEILHSFRDGKKDGSHPFAGIVFDAVGNIYGTTVAGGKFGNGTVFELVDAGGDGRYKEKVLWSFDGTDGSDPDGNLFLDSAGTLYGTTYFGGSSNAGVVFKVTPNKLVSSPNP